jgi:hypothetical protein
MRIDVCEEEEAVGESVTETEQTCQWVTKLSPFYSSPTLLFASPSSLSTTSLGIFSEITATEFVFIYSSFFPEGSMPNCKISQLKIMIVIYAKVLMYSYV